MKIETKRLELIPLTWDQLKLWCYDIKSLEKELNCIYKAEPMEGIFFEIVKGQYEITKNDPQNYLYHTFFFIVRKEDRVVVGSADFKDVPNDKGEIEIGYGLGKEFEHNGYMTEAAEALCKWGLGQDKVTKIIAETEADNIKSHKVLERLGFKKYKSDETLLWELS